MHLRITEFTWVHTSLFALSVGLVTSACDDPGAVAEEDLTVESVEDAVYDRALEDEFAVSDEAEEDPDAALEERGRRGGWKGKRDDDDDKGWKGKRDDDDNKGWKSKRDDDDRGWKGKRDDDDNKGWKSKWDDDDR